MKQCLAHTTIEIVIKYIHTISLVGSQMSQLMGAKKSINFLKFQPHGISVEMREPVGDDVTLQKSPLVPNMPPQANSFENSYQYIKSPYLSGSSFYY